MHRMLSMAETDQQRRKIKKMQLHGFEQHPCDVACQ
jgi:hypothetical protein